MATRLIVLGWVSLCAAGRKDTDADTWNSPWVERTARVLNFSRNEKEQTERWQKKHLVWWKRVFRSWVPCDAAASYRSSCEPRKATCLETYEEKLSPRGIGNSLVTGYVKKTRRGRPEPINDDFVSSTTRARARRELRVYKKRRASSFARF